MSWFLKCITKDYFNFKGRARRKEYWMFVLFYCLITLLLSLGIAAIIRALGSSGDPFSHPLLLIIVIFWLGVFIPALAVSVRRLHDIGKSGWWLLPFCILNLIPIIGLISQIVLLVFFCLDSEKGTNRFGPNPKGIEQESIEAN